MKGVADSMLINEISSSLMQIPVAKSLIIMHKDGSTGLILSTANQMYFKKSFRGVYVIKRNVWIFGN